MTGVHATGGFALLYVSAVFVACALICSRMPSWGRALTMAKNVLVALIGAQVLIGAILYLQGRRPGESLHLLYGAAALVTLPAATTFAIEAPPKARAAVLATAGVVVCGLIWRLIATGESS